MKKLILLLLPVLFALTLTAQVYIPADAGSSVKFTIKNFSINVPGSFKGLQGKIIFDPLNPASSSVNVSVDANTIYTANSSRDKHLKKEIYFHVARYPRISFQSTRISKTDQPGTYLIEGTLLIKGVSKTISFPFTSIPTTNGLMLAGKFRINRRDFNVGESSWVLSDELTVSLSVTAVKQ